MESFIPQTQTASARGSGDAQRTAHQPSRWSLPVKTAFHVPGLRSVFASQGRKIQNLSGRFMGGMRKLLDKANASHAQAGTESIELEALSAQAGQPEAQTAAQPARKRLRHHEELKKMSQSGEALHGALVNEVVTFARECPGMSWPDAFEYAAWIEEWALHSCDQKKAIADSDGNREQRSGPQAELSRAEQGDGASMQLRRTRSFEFRHFQIISESLLEILSFHFKENVEKLEAEAVKLSPGLDLGEPTDGAEPGLAAGDDWTAFEQYHRDMALFEGVRDFVAQASRNPQAPERFNQILEQVRRLPSSVAETSRMLRGTNETHQHSFRAQALALLAGTLDFKRGDYAAAYINIVRQAGELPDPREQAFVKRALWPRSRAFFYACQGWRAQDRHDPQRIRQALDTVAEVMEGLDAVPVRHGLAEAESVSASTIWSLDSLEAGFPEVSPHETASEHAHAPQAWMPDAMQAASFSSSGFGTSARDAEQGAEGQPAVGLSLEEYAQYTLLSYTRNNVCTVLDEMELVMARVDAAGQATLRPRMERIRLKLLGNEKQPAQG